MKNHWAAISKDIRIPKVLCRGLKSSQVTLAKFDGKVIIRLNQTGKHRICVSTSCAAIAARNWLRDEQVPIGYYRVYRTYKRIELTLDPQAYPRRINGRIAPLGSAPDYTFQERRDGTEQRHPHIDNAAYERRCEHAPAVCRGGCLCVCGPCLEVFLSNRERFYER